MIRVGSLDVSLHQAQTAIARFSEPGRFAYQRYDLDGRASDPSAIDEADLRRPRYMSTPPSRGTADWLRINAVPIWLAHLPKDPSESLEGLSDPDVRELFTDLFAPLTHAGAPSGRNTKEALVSKILHVKRPHLIPVFDTYLHRAYAGLGNGDRRYWRTIYRNRPENMARYVLHVRDDVRRQRDSLEALAKIPTEAHGLEPMTPLRCLDVTGWMILRGNV